MWVCVLIAYHYIKEVKNDLAIHFISSKECMADILTKNVTAGVFGHIVPIYTGTAVPTQYKATQLVVALAVWAT